MPGPVPKRSTERRRRNKVEGLERVLVTGLAPVDAPVADPEWHPIARDWFASLRMSGQSVFYEPSDWQTARYVAEAMSRNLCTGRFSAQLFAAVMAASASLLATEGDRRRLRVELERGGVDEDEAASVTAMDRYRGSLGA